MNSIVEAVNQIVPPTRRISIFDDFRRMQEEIEQNPDVQKLRQIWPKPEKGPDHFTLSQLTQYAKGCENCRECPGLEGCKNQVPGYFPTLDEKLPMLTNVPCDLQKAAVKRAELSSKIQSQYIKPHILKSTFKKLIEESCPERKPALLEAMKFCKEFTEGETHQGLYLYGPMGRGKSAIAGAIANELAGRGVDVLMVYVPDFIREIKEAINKGGIEEKVEAMRKVSVLILDEIGGEQLGTWTRDEILAPILQDRMEIAPIIYTSNLTLEQLETHFANAVRKKDEDKAFGVLRAQRMMERIEPFVDAVHVLGRNWRRERKANA